MTSSFPNSIRIILLILSLLSFLPQLHHLWVRKDSSGISLYYVLYNLISATEQLTITFVILVNNTEGADFFAHKPPTTGDWLNLSEVATTWLLSLAYFAECLYLPSGYSSSRKLYISSIYSSFLLISLVPVFVDALEHACGPEDSYHKWGVSFFLGIHAMLINWIVTLLGVVAIYCQARELLSHPSSAHALSVIGLVVQAVVFIVLSITWVFRLSYPYDQFNWWQPYAWIAWYQLVGWIVFDNAIFAVGQAMLLWLVTRHLGWKGATSDETQPLLHV